MSESPVVILGCGYTGRRVAERLLGRGISVLCTTRDPSKLEDLARRGAAVVRVEVLEPDTLASCAGWRPRAPECSTRFR
jgi:Trk K+ transport system NAD-binding subunit